MKHKKHDEECASRAKISSGPRASGQRAASAAPPSYGIDILDRMGGNVVQRRKSSAALPDPLKAGIERLSGSPVDDVKVYYDSSEPAQLQAAAFTRGTDIHLAPGQAEHLPHEAWHVVQQKQGRVRPTTQLRGHYINADPSLEREADVEGTKALRGPRASKDPGKASKAPRQRREATPTIQRKAVYLPKKGLNAPMDYVEWNSLAFASKLAGGAPEEFDSAKYDDLKEEEKVGFIGHGSPGKAAGRTGDEIADKLTHDKKGMPDGNHDIFFTSCHAGNSKLGKAVIDVVKERIVGKWKEATGKVIGAEHVSIKTLDESEKEQWAISKDDAADKVRVKVQKALNKAYGESINIKVQKDVMKSAMEMASDVMKAKRPYFLDFINAWNGEWDKVSSIGQSEIEAALEDKELQKLKKGEYAGGRRTV